VLERDHGKTIEDLTARLHRWIMLVLQGPLMMKGFSPEAVPPLFCWRGTYRRPVSGDRHPPPGHPDRARRPFPACPFTPQAFGLSANPTTSCSLRGSANCGMQRLEILTRPWRWEASAASSTQAPQEMRRALPSAPLSCCWPFPYLLRTAAEVSQCAGVNTCLVRWLQWRQRAGWPGPGWRTLWHAAGGQTIVVLSEDPAHHKQPLESLAAGSTRQLVNPGPFPNLREVARRPRLPLANRTERRMAIGFTTLTAASTRVGQAHLLADGSAAKVGGGGGGAACRWDQVTW